MDIRKLILVSSNAPLSSTPWVNILIICTLTFFSTASSTFASPWYGSISASKTQGELPNNGSSGPSPFTALETDETSSGFKLSAGYTLTTNFSFEFGYTHLGKQTIEVYNDFSSLINGTYNPFSNPVSIGVILGNSAPNINPNTQQASLLPYSAPQPGNFLAGAITGSKSTIKNYGLHLIGKGKFPITSQIDFLLKGGVLLAETKTETTSIIFQWVTIGSGLTTTDPFIYVPIKNTKKYRNVDPVLGLGMSVNLTDKISAEISADKYFGVAYGDDVEADFLSYELAISYQF
ncbi:MAG: hypothetical protein K6L75_03870 [Cellvibrionaceae bacterium]